MQNQHQSPLNNQNLKSSPPQLIKADGMKNVNEDLSGVRWYVNSTSEERVNLVNGELASWGWDINSYSKCGYFGKVGAALIEQVLLSLHIIVARYRTFISV